MINKSVIPVLAVSMLAGTLIAQAPKSQALLMALGANVKQMKTYQWKQRTTVFRKGNPLEPKIDEVRFDASGQLQRITLSQPEQKRMGPLRARKAAEVKESVQEVMQLAARYANPQQLSLAIQKGELWEGPGALRLQARSVVLPIDEMTIRIDATTYLPTRIDCKTLYEGHPVTISVDYQQLPNGPSMASRMTVQMPKEDIVVQVESYDFVRLAGPVSF